MFTGIIESLGKVLALTREGSNLHLDLSCSFVQELKIDQSVAHNGVCLTVVKVHADSYRVTAIDETLRKTNLGDLKSGDAVNLERCLKIGDRLDGHWVLGHVDQTATCDRIEVLEGSWKYTFSFDSSTGNFTVEKGSVCVNGISLTVVDSDEGKFSVAIIPYTFEHTNLQFLKQGDRVNLEFDVLGKYLKKLSGPYGTR